MKVALSLVAIAFGAGAALATPVSARSALVKRYDIAADVAAVGQCPLDCWTEAAGNVDCDPEADDACLCGTFFDEVSSCAGSTCNIGENLAALDFMEQACN
ncbi:hypothetical protein CC86DRAFT_326873 [Ophiobolus disseminans]|uniref:CFEM domain-containing protein n=1 Tax=Ophiobolus disseminans TaxID=1469910 RepID=A0A6A6ZVC7_9PLEO|nr:hypothetical protein CC86DRAFT_326873 [Ophiobolus disseminans]